ncbi:tetraspanin-6 isoform X2 [Toxorhynchites rutilus septentrionalis]|uniref:tetraspanin-6 isoform X2 n=1 Tax=Toxorhynchites rutilus septentrionalis TaxID=329112 RepID=UPI002479C10A|nr:tetraspanin-6 isoform X2 [Toxorhynchites rutilus septentrionalis]
MHPISGLILLVAGIVVLLDVSDYQHFVEEKLLAPPVVLIVVGAFVFLVASLGCYGAIKESPKLLNAFAVFLLIVLLIEVAVAIAAVAFKFDLENALETQLKKSIMRRNSADMSAWESVQKQMMCCGIEGPKDWYDNNNRTMPASCCKPDLIDSESNDCKNAPPLFMDRYYQKGCLMKLKEHFDKNAVVLIAVGFVISGLQLLGVIFACWLSAAIKRDKH